MTANDACNPAADAWSPGSAITHRQKRLYATIVATKIIYKYFPLIKFQFFLSSCFTITVPCPSIHPNSRLYSIHQLICDGAAAVDFYAFLNFNYEKVFQQFVQAFADVTWMQGILMCGWLTRGCVMDDLQNV